MSLFKGIVSLTKSQYNALATKDADTLYVTTDEIATEVPAYSASDAGKVLSVNAQGALAWVGQDYKSGQFTYSGETGYDYSIDTGLQEIAYNRFAIFRCTSVWTEESGVYEKYALALRYVDFTEGTSSWILGGSATAKSVTAVEAGNLTEGRWKVERSGTTISFSGYSNAPKLVNGFTYRWIAWNEV